MALLNNPYIIDIIIGLFLIIYTFIGYLKGFIIRLYDFFSLFIAYFLTINFSFPLSKLITLYQLEGLLEPIEIEKYKDTYKIIYKCLKCKEIHKNIMAKDDDMNKIIEISNIK